MIRTSGKVYETVKHKLEEMGLDTSTLKIVTFSRSTYHDASLGDRIIGTYEHRSREYSFQEPKA